MRGREVRTDLGLGALDRLDPMTLAEDLGVPVVGLSQFASVEPQATALFAGVEEAAFSALTVFHGRRRLIVHNDAHDPRRQSSDVAHELAHALLLHDPTPAFDERGLRIWDPVVEAEAEWLAGVLLVPEEIALEIVRQAMSLGDAASWLGVTPKMIQYRVNVTGAKKRIERAARWRRGRK